MALTHERLKEILQYDPETGLFVWSRPSSNRVKAGQLAGSALNGYIYITVDGRHIQAHRLAWMFMHGEMPPSSLDIDHINGSRSDNRFCNIRCVSKAGNSQNQRTASSRSKSGVLGVSLNKCGSWVATITTNGRRRYLGSYSTVERAYAAYVDAKRVLHPTCTI